jgi:hypothetical protein
MLDRASLRTRSCSPAQVARRTLGLTREASMPSTKPQARSRIGSCMTFGARLAR